MENKSDKWHALHAETAAIAWKDLERFFAKGNLLRVSTDIDLVDAACEIANDNKSAIEKWTADGSLAGVSNEEASLWAKGDSNLWSVIVLPWILVQQRK
ncbi:MAG: hypothetical protein A6F70_02455 [Cycloclasticus sp. symbiont of Bathymodiolus heckerae]|nr:MAG: hypothetical protein A6F70_02455 [Cycloclasticus sp. symbiont of Bathymodiolus heckerae]